MPSTDRDALDRVCHAIVIAGHGMQLGGPAAVQRRAEQKARELGLIFEFVMDPWAFLQRLK